MKRQDLSNPFIREQAVVLLVDDDDTVRETSADMLEDLGYTVMQASSGPEALALLDGNEVDVMVTDIRMPGMSGLELSDIAGSRFQDLKIILVSGYFVPQAITRRFLQKPFRTRDLDRAIQAELAALDRV